VKYRLQHGSLFVTSFVFLMGLLFKVDGVSAKSPSYSLLSFLMLLCAGAFIASWALTVMLALVRTLSGRHPVLSRRLALFLTTENARVFARRPSRASVGECVTTATGVVSNPLSLRSSAATTMSRDGVPLRSNPMLLARMTAGGTAPRASSPDSRTRGPVQVRHSSGDVAASVTTAAAAVVPETPVAIVDRVRQIRKTGSRPAPPPLSEDSPGALDARDAVHVFGVSEHPPVRAPPPPPPPHVPQP
jgi:hypothetical protein